MLPPSAAMVRFYWHVDDGCSAHVPVNGVTLADSEPTCLAVEMDVPGVAGSAVGLMSMPPCTEDGKVSPMRNIGIVIAHDVDAASWQGPLLTSIAQVCCASACCAVWLRRGVPVQAAAILSRGVQCLAKRGFIVMRNYCNLKELRRLRMFEKALDTVSKSPYATSAGVSSWLLVGIGNGARVAATVSSKAKTNIAGLAVVSYPLHESTPPAGKGAGFPDSTSQLIKCSAPLLVLQGELDARCSTGTMSAFLRQLRPQQPGPRFGIIPGVNESLLGTDDAILTARTLVRFSSCTARFGTGHWLCSGHVCSMSNVAGCHALPVYSLCSYAVCRCAKYCWSLQRASRLRLEMMLTCLGFRQYTVMHACCPRLHHRVLVLSASSSICQCGRILPLRTSRPCRRAFQCRAARLSCSRPVVFPASFQARSPP